MTCLDGDDEDELMSMTGADDEISAAGADDDETSTMDDGSSDSSPVLITNASRGRCVGGSWASDGPEVVVAVLVSAMETAR